MQSSELSFRARPGGSRGPREQRFLPLDLFNFLRKLEFVGAVRSAKIRQLDHSTHTELMKTQSMVCCFCGGRERSGALRRERGAHARRRDAG